METSSSLLLYGGGNDSSALALEFGTRGNYAAVFFRYSQKAQELEELAVRRICSIYDIELHIITLDPALFGKSAILAGAVAADVKDNIVDGRNLVFISQAAALAASLNRNYLHVGFHIEPTARPFPDASSEFLDSINNTLNTALVHKVQVVAPYANLTREEIYKRGYKLNPEAFGLAHTCYEAVTGGCGVCAHCKVQQDIIDNW